VNIDARALIVCGIHPTQAKQFAEPVFLACTRFAINTPARVAAFVAQASHESAGFTRLEENLNYRTPEILDSRFSAVRGLADAAALIARGPEAIANRVYANREGNGDEASGDGWRYRGRGLFQLTGRAKYRRAGQDLDKVYEGFPELVQLPLDAAMTAAWFWTTRIPGGFNVLADTSQIDRITELINGPAMLGADERRAHFEQGLLALA
jgi:putative chitinase